MAPTEHHVDEPGAVTQRLLERAWMYDDPDSYVAGVQAALAAVATPAPPASAAITIVLDEGLVGA